MIGDVVGSSGRQAVERELSGLRNRYAPDCVIINGENAAGGFGITPEIADRFFAMGADVITLGNHSWNKREIYQYIDREPRLLRPANFAPGAPGSGWGIFNINGVKLCVMSLQGRALMEPLDCPFRTADHILKEVAAETSIIVVDFHAETTSEKRAFGFYVDGRVSAVIGTHTHVQTADAQILSKGTAFLTDVGMTGPKDSVIGMKVEAVVPKFVTQMPSRFEVSENEAQLCAVLLDIDAFTGRAVDIKRIQRPKLDNSD